MLCNEFLGLNLWGVGSAVGSSRCCQRWEEATSRHLGLGRSVGFRLLEQSFVLSLCQWSGLTFRSPGFSSPIVSFLPRSLARWRNAVASDASSNRFKELLHAHVTLDRTCLQKYFFVGDAEEIRCSTSGSLVAKDSIEFVSILYCEYAEFYPC